MDDDVAAATSVRRKTSVDVRVPLGAVPGPVAVVDSDGAVSAPSVGPVALEPAAPAVAPRSRWGCARRAPTTTPPRPRPLTYVVHGRGAGARSRVDVVRVLDGAVIAHWDVPPSRRRRAAGHVGRQGSAGRCRPTASYEFRVTVAGLAPASAAFEFLGDRFPILGPVRVRHRRRPAFGGGRGHQGEDMFAACGTPLVAAHGGTVKFAGYHARAGNYLVIDNEGDGHRLRRTCTCATPRW